MQGKVAKGNCQFCFSGIAPDLSCVSCGVSVHAKCVGQAEGTADWTCPACAWPSKERPTCVVCPKTEDAGLLVPIMAPNKAGGNKPTRSTQSGWWHKGCELWMPSVVKLKGFDRSKLPSTW